MMWTMAETEFQGLSVIIVEDDPLLRKRLAARLEDLGMDVTGADTLEAARRLLANLDFDFLILDVNLPDGLGTALFQERLIPAATSVIVMTAHGAIAGAVEAMKLGASDYLVKPFDLVELPLAMAQARRTSQTLRRQEHQRSDRSDLFFGSTLAELKAQLEKILAADRRVRGPLPPILIHGETGTGKTTLARWIHEQGPRSQAPLLEVNCSALPESLAESELFGHERGAFTDARSARMGLFEAADGGTLFLDELPSLTAALQAKVLTAIDDHRIRRLGSTKSLSVNARLIAATNRDLRALVAQGAFREDLYHRLDLYRVFIPALRDRGADILVLAEQLIARICQRHGLRPRKLSGAGEKRILAYPWPGNVRELAHELERALVFEEDNQLHLVQLGPEPGRPVTADSAQTNWLREDFQFESGFSLENAIDRFIELALQKTEGNVSAAARLLGVPRDYVRYRLRQKP
jgi:DNA-binding NtrC family response regulator